MIADINGSARAVRSSIVQRVFNDTLNTTWRQLFLRLAPDEAFVPAFVVPSSDADSVVTKLETIHRSGAKAGTPGTMLSAANLNTAALTLFLALHFSAEPRLPWILLDDPVQSMDDVHIAQLAVLLKTLSREYGRQLVIAVHDRPLFEYLSLELGPAFEGDRLISIALGRSPSGESFANPDFYVWKPDPAVAA